MARESSFKNMLLCLFLICLLGSAILGGVYILTKEPIEKAQTEKVNAAIAQVVPAFDNQPSDEVFPITVEGKSIMVYPAKSNGQIVGYALQASTSKGFGGTVVVMAGFLPDGTIYKTALIAHSETPGLGDNLDPKKSSFSQQFEGKNPRSYKMAVRKDGGEVDAITAATISSRAFCDVLNKAYAAFMQIQQEGGTHE